MAASATFALKAGVWFPNDYAKCELCDGSNTILDNLTLILKLLDLLGIQDRYVSHFSVLDFSDECRSG